MMALPIIGSVIGLAGSFMSASATIAGANAQAQAQSQLAHYQANVARIKGSQEEAAAQRQQLEANRKAKLLQSKLQARASASGAGASDPTVVGLTSDIAGRGQYQGALQMWSGQMRSWDYDTDADIKEWQAAASGEILKSNAKASALGTILGGLGSFVGNIGGSFKAPSSSGPQSPVMQVYEDPTKFMYKPNTDFYGMYG